MVSDFLWKIILWWKKKQLKQLKRIRIEKKRKLKDANQGGFQAQMEVCLKQFWPKRQGLVWLFWSCIWGLTGVHPGFHLLAIGLGIMAIWQAVREAHGRDIEWVLHMNTLGQKSRIIWGTWESNPGPNACNTPHQPTEPGNAFVHIMENKRYIKKQC